MATTQMLYVLAAPLSADHGICCLQNTPQSGFFTQQGSHDIFACGNPDDPEFRVRADHIDAFYAGVASSAFARIQARDDLAEMMRSRLPAGDHRDSVLRNPIMQLSLLAPSLNIGESSDIPDGHPYWDLSQSMAVLSCDMVMKISHAMISSVSLENWVAAQTFLKSHVGQVVVLQGA